MPKRIISLLLMVSLCVVTLIMAATWPRERTVTSQPVVPEVQAAEHYWLLLLRKSQKEQLFLGNPGDQTNSNLIREFIVKTGIPGKRPTPLPQLVGREYWLITSKMETPESPETAPYFLTLDVPYTPEPPYGPAPYLECDGQCNWELPGSFGLHGIAGNREKIAAEDLGSSGCIRHLDEDITYLYNLLDPTHQEIRYYIQDS